MKRLCALLLLCVLLTGTVAGCSKAEFYEEETELHSWIQDRIGGYERIDSSARMVLRKDEAGISLQIDTGSSGMPRLTVKDGKNYASASEESLLTVTSQYGLYATASHQLSHYDPYRNCYMPSMQVFRKDDTTFRLFFFLYGSSTDFYPLPKILTEEQYQAVLEVLNEYTETERIKSENKDEKPVNYAGEFMGLYETVYQSGTVKNPDGKLIYQHTGAESEYASLFRTKMDETLHMSEQDWRRSFEKLGYTGYHPNLVVLYADLVAASDAAELTLYSSDAWFSDAAEQFRGALIYQFCPGIADYDFVRVTEK